MEVILATGLLALAAVPIINGMTRAAELAGEVELRSTAAMLAQREMETALAALAEDFTTDVSKDSEPLGGGYLVTIDGEVSGLTAAGAVQVGWDEDGDGELDASEVLVTLATLVTDRGD